MQQIHLMNSRESQVDDTEADLAEATEEDMAEVVTVAVGMEVVEVDTEIEVAGTEIEVAGMEVVAAATVIEEAEATEATREAVEITTKVTKMQSCQRWQQTTQILCRKFSDAINDSNTT